VFFNNYQIKTGWRFLSIVMVIALGIFVPSAESAPEETAEVKLTFWNIHAWDPPKWVIEDLVEKFNAEHPTIYVDLLHVTQMEQKLLTAIVGKVPPEVAGFDRFRIAGYAEREAFTPLDQLVKTADVNREDFFAAPWNECEYRGKLWAVPFQTDVRVLYYNRDSFTAAGLDPDKPPRTWKELREVSKKFTTRHPNGALKTTGFIPYYGFGETWLYLFGWQKKAQFLSDDGTTALLDSPELIDALQWVRDFTAFYGHDELRIFRSGFATQELAPFLTGEMAMVGDNTFMLSRIRRYKPDLNFSVAPLPWPEDGQRATWSGGFSLVIPQGTKHQREAMEFIKYMVSPESQLYWAKTARQIPANKTVTSDPFFQDDPHLRVCINELQYTHHRPVTPAGAILWDELAKAWEYGGAGIVGPAEALRRANKTVQAEIDRYQKERDFPQVPLLLALTSILAFLLIVIGAHVWRSWQKIPRYSVKRHEAYAGYLFALPALLGLLFFWVGPVIVSAIYSFCRYDILTPARWVGAKNYGDLIFDDPLFWKSLWNTVYYVVLAVPLSVSCSLGLALLLNQKLKAQSMWRTLFYLPSLVPLVALSLLFLWLFNGRFGLFNLALGWLGLPPIKWLTSPEVAKLSMVLMNLWTLGGGMIIFLAGLQSVPRHLTEAAMIDGAGPLQRFRHVTIPALAPTLFFMIVINTIGALQVFTRAFLMTSGTGSPEESTLFYLFYLYRQGFRYFRMGYASALAWILFVIAVLLTLLQFWLAKKWGYEEALP
jgi:multiple sugar transport system permease protein